MDCNKDEALRAKEIAEKKMEKNDFEGAQKIIVKAQNLYPELENVNQLLSICEVHCSARKSILGSEKDWYGILQVDRLSDEVTVKKQYRRLALFLHPDKNRFPGAESAFKLICEANAVLSDPGKKALYDSKIRMPVRSALSNPPPHHMNKKTQFNKQYGAQSNFAPVFTSVNQHQATQSSSSIRRESFWTSCPFCSMRYMYDRKFVNTSVSCQKCSKNFMTYEISAKDIPLGSKWGPPGAQSVPAQQGVSQSAAGIQEKGVPHQGNSKMGVKNDLRSSAAHVRSQRKTNSRTVKPETGSQTENVSKEKRDLKRKSREKGRKRKVESSESSDSSSESDLEDVTVKTNFDNATSHLNSEPGYAPRRSSRKRTNVSYNEGDDDDVPSSLKTPGSELSEDKEHEKKDDLDGENLQNGFPTTEDYSNSKSKKEMPSVHPEESLHDKNAVADHDKEVKARVQTGRTSDHGADAIEIETDSDQDSHSRDNLDADLCHCDDPEFNDFDKDRDESCFVANQLWACYDELDGMPRFYAKVKSVRASPFELSITWLEADSTDEAQKQWIDAGLPVGCGIFELGKTDKTSLRLSFSHLVHFEKGKKRGSLVIYPRVGEVWALFKHWDLSWSHDPENHQEYKYEVVEVLSDFVAGAGVKVCYLDKIGGFVSLFQRSSQSEADSFLIGPSELYKFSHRVPSFKMKGTEREGVPVGSFELDPASLPLKPDDLYYPGKAVKETENVGA